MAAQKKIPNNNYSLLTSSVSLFLGGLALGAALSLIVLKSIPFTANCPTVKTQVSPTPTKTVVPVKVVPTKAVK